MERTLVKNTPTLAGQTVLLSGWVDIRRDHGKLTFIDLRDGSGKIQCVALPSHAEAHAAAKELRPEWVVTLTGIVNKRPANSVNKDLPTGEVELEITAIEIISKAEELPFEKDTEVNLDTLLDHRPLTLRSERSRDIFKMQAAIVDAYRTSLQKQGFTEFQAPALVGGDAEGGAAVFKVEYFEDQTAYLATSPQLYKQIMVGAFERAFTVAKIFRAEKSATTRHLSEITQMDFEVGFIKNHLDVMKVLEQTIKDTVEAVVEKHGDMFKRFGIETPRVPQNFPILTLKEAHETLGVASEPDMIPEHERGIAEWALKEKGSDFVFITNFPTENRAFYTYEEPSEKPFSRSFDLLFRGLEINSGSQRIHDYSEMIKKIESRGMDPKKFQFYLQAFKYGMPPHGGSSTGLERFTSRMLGLPNVKEAVPFPRDINRIDTLLSE